MFNLSSSIILVTGGYGYLGSAIVKGYARAGATVIVGGRSFEKFESVFKDESSKNSIYFQELDLLDEDSINYANQKVKEKFGSINVLVNNAHSLFGRKYLDVSIEDWNLTLDSSLNSIYKCIRIFSEDMILQKSGKIINTASIYGLGSPYFDLYNKFPNFVIPPQYAAVKGAIIQLTKYFAGLFGQYSINVNSVSPGPFPNFESIKNLEFIESLSDKTMLKRVGKPEDLQGIYCLLASKESSYITGQNFIVDGGWSAY